LVQIQPPQPYQNATIDTKIVAFFILPETPKQRSFRNSKKRQVVHRFFVQKNKSNETIAEYNETIELMVAFFRGGCIPNVSLEFAVSLNKFTKNGDTLNHQGIPIFLL